MLTLDDDLKLVILEYHNYHLSISLEHSIDKTWNYFQSLIPITNQTCPSIDR